MLDSKKGNLTVWLSNQLICH